MCVPQKAVGGKQQMEVINFEHREIVASEPKTQALAIHFDFNPELPEAR
jgi:hypothetical protein